MARTRSERHSPILVVLLVGVLATACHRSMDRADTEVEACSATSDCPAGLRCEAQACAYPFSEVECPSGTWDDDANEATACSIWGGEAVDIASGATHSCSLRRDGELFCWGREPVATAPIDDVFRTISSGDGMSCGVLASDRSIRCWGHMGWSDVRREGPLASVSAGDDYNVCGLGLDGIVDCWALEGESVAPVPFKEGAVPVPPDDKFVAVGTRGYHACGVRERERQITCWGSGELAGQNLRTEGGFSQVTVGAKHVCGLRTLDQTVRCVGENTYGQLDVPTVALSSISGGAHHTCGIEASSGLPVCWGNNASSQTEAPQVGLLAISAGLDHVCGIRVSDSIPVCWGGDSFGQARFSVP